MDQRRTGDGRTNYTRHSSDAKKTTILVARPNPPFNWEFVAAAYLPRKPRVERRRRILALGRNRAHHWPHRSRPKQKAPFERKPCPRQATFNLTRHFVFPHALLLLTRDPFIARGRAGDARYPSSRLPDQALTTSRLFRATENRAPPNPGTATNADIHWNVGGGLTLQVSPKVTTKPTYNICSYSSTTIWPPTNGPTPR